MSEGVLGSGQGIADAFIGQVCANPDAPKKEQKYERAQILHNAFLWLDEGQTLACLAKQTSNTTLPTLRSAAMGAMLGPLNADPDKRRKVTNYHLGVYIGWQPCSVGPLLDEVMLGTPQRFLFCAMGPVIEGKPESCAIPILNPPPTHVPVFFADELQREIRTRHIEQKRRARRIGSDPDWLSHANLLQCKVAALLCLIDHGQIVTPDDWRLAALLIQIPEPIKAVPGKPHDPAGLADAAELLRQLQHTNLVADDLLVPRHRVVSSLRYSMSTLADDTPTIAACQI